MDRPASSPHAEGKPAHLPAEVVSQETAVRSMKGTATSQTQLLTATFGFKAYKFKTENWFFISDIYEIRFGLSQWDTASDNNMETFPTHPTPPP